VRFSKWRRANIESSPSSEEENSGSDYSSSNESGPISEAKKFGANLSKPENAGIARNPKGKKILIWKGFSTNSVLFHTILTDLGSAQTVRVNTVYSISIISKERLMIKILL